MLSFTFGDFTGGGWSRYNKLILPSIKKSHCDFLKQFYN